MACFEALSQVQEKNLVSFGFLGGAIINKIAFLLISLLIQKSPFRTHQAVAQSVETLPGNRRVDGSSPAIGGGVFDVSFNI